MVINRLNEFFLSERWMVNRWQLPVVGLLIAAGLAGTVSALQAAAPQKSKQAVDSTSIASTLHSIALQQQQSTIDTTSIASTLPTPIAQKQQPADNSTPVTAPLPAATPQEQEPTLDSTALSSNWEVAVPQEQEPTLDSIASEPTLKTETPQKTATPKKVAVSHKQEKAVESTVDALPSPKWNRKAQTAHKGTIAQLPTSETSLPDGIYLYGKSSQPGEIGKEYLVFQANQGRVVGALYMPNSEYSCFSGTFNSKQLDLTVANAYNQTAMAHTVARSQPTQLAAVGTINLENTYDSLSYPHTVQLDGYQPISRISDNDKQILNSCQSNP